MTKEITKANILQELTDKLKLRDFVAANFLLDETVVPVYNIEQHLEEWWQKFAQKSITTTGPVEFFGIPGNEKWVVKRYDVVFMTGAFTIAGVFVSRKHEEVAGTSVYLDLEAAQSTSYHVETDVTLTRGDSLNINVDGYTSTGDIRLYIDYKKEIIR